MCLVFKSSLFPCVSVYHQPSPIYFDNMDTVESMFPEQWWAPSGVAKWEGRGCAFAPQ